MLLFKSNQAMIEYDFEGGGGDFQAVEECSTEDTEDTEENILAYSKQHQNRHHRHHKSSSVHTSSSSRQRKHMNHNDLYYQAACLDRVPKQTHSNIRPVNVNFGSARKSSSKQKVSDIRIANFF